MDLGARQTRNFLLAGTTALPTPFSKTGTIALDVGHFTYHPGDKAIDDELLIVLEYCGNETVLREMLRSDVPAIFIHGEGRGGGAFQMSHEPWVENFEKGVWFLGPDITEAKVRARLNLPTQDISTRDSVLRGVAFVIEGRPMLQITEVAQAAGEFEDGGYPCCYGTCCKNFGCCKNYGASFKMTCCKN